MSAAGHIVLILNPAARRARSDARGALIRALAAAGELDVHTTRAGGEATALAAGAADGARVVVAAGGDGTVTQVASALGEGSPPLLPFPLGNANVFARSLGWPADPIIAAARVGRVIADGPETRIVTPWDVHTDHGVGLALMNLGVGMDAHVVEWIENRQDLKRRAGQLGFAAGAMVAAAAARDRRLEVRSDDDRGVPAHSLIAALGRPWAWFGARALDLLPDACHDGILHWIATDGSVIDTARRALTGVAGPAETVGRARRRLRISSDAPVPVQADGEPLGRSHVISATPGAPIAVVPAD